MTASRQPVSDITGLRPLSGAWLAVVLLWFVAFLNYLDRVTITTMRDSLVQAIPMSDAEFGLLTSVFLWVYGVLSPFAGFLADRFQRSRVIIASVFVWSAVTLLTSQAKTFHELLFARALMGVSEACYLPAALALITDYHRGSTRSLATGLHLTGLSVGAALAGMGGWGAERYGWSHVFLWFGLAGVVYSLLLIFVLRDPEARTACSKAGHPPHFWSALQHLFSRGSFFLLLVYWGFIGLAGWAVAGWMPTYLEQQFHLSQGKAGLSATGYVYFAGLGGLVAGGWLADRWSRKHERGRIYVAVLGMCASAPGIFLAARSGWYWPAVSGLMLFGFARAFTDSNTMPILCSVVDPRYRATGFGVLNFFANGIGGLTVYAGGWLRDARVNVRHIFELGGLGMLVCAVLLFFVRPSAPSLLPAAEGASPAS